MKKNYFLFAFLLFSIFYMRAQTSIATFAAGNTSTNIFPSSALTLDSRALASATLNYNGLTTQNDARSVFISSNSSSTLDVNTAPYVNFKLNNSAANLINFDRFVIPAYSPTSATTKLQLRWNVDNYTTSLGEFTRAPDFNYALTSINLTGKVTANSNIEFRIYAYNGAASLFFPRGGTYATFDSTPSSYRGDYGFAIFATSFLGVNDNANSSNNKIKLYPNPATDYIQISNLPKTSDYTIVNEAGAVVKKGNISANERLNVKSLTPGLYFLNDDSGNSLKFIKK